MDKKDLFAKTLITGSDGMVGSYVDFGIRTTHRSMDVTDLNEVMSVFKKTQPSAVIHLAAEVDFDRCERDPEYTYFVNSIGTYNIVEAARSVGAKMVYVSTSAVFDGAKGLYSEDDKPNPKSYYGRSKYLGELIVKDMLDEYIIARICWVFGGGPQKDLKFVAKMIKQLDQPEIRVVNDKIGSPTFGKDVISGIKQLLMDGKTGTFHLSNKGEASRYEVATEIAKVLGSTTKIIPVDSSYFNISERNNNESMVSKIDIMRPWQEALKEYLKTEWGNIGARKRT